MNKLLLVVLIIGLVAIPAEGFFGCVRKAKRAAAKGEDPCVIAAAVEDCLGFGGQIVDDILAGIGISC